MLWLNRITNNSYDLMIIELSNSHINMVENRKLKILYIDSPYRFLVITYFITEHRTLFLLYLAL